MDTNLHLYFTQEDYDALSGPDWPSYQQLVNGEQAKKPQVQDEINGFIKMFKSDGIKFPIKTKTACQSKWTWSTIWLNSLSSSSCHRVKASPVDLNNFDNFHNLPKKLNDRRLMLNGEWPSGGCETCRVVEEAGGWSDRQHNLNIRGLTPPELLTDPTAVSVSPKIVEIFAQNVCNLACVYCNGKLSSKIEQEGIKFGEFNKNNVRIPVITTPTSAAKEYFDKFIDWLDRNVQTLVRLHLLGGETFIQHELINSVLDIIERRPNPQLELCVFSNLNVPDKYWNLYITRIRDLQRAGNIRVFDLTASIDCWGAEQVYVRSGLNLKKFEERFAWASEQGNWLRLNANQTITSMTIRSMPDLFNMINKYNKHRHIGHYFQFLTGLEYQHPDAFGYNFWADDFDRILNAMPTDTNEQREAIPRMVGMQRQLQQVSQHDYQRIGQLHTYLDELDRRRSTDWRSVFPYLDIHNSQD
jgi:pyruvate-formate lyase-activating enzyme